MEIFFKLIKEKEPVAGKEPRVLRVTGPYPTYEAADWDLEWNNYPSEIVYVPTFPALHKKTV